MKYRQIFLLAAFLINALYSQGRNEVEKGYIIVTDYLKADGKKDVSDEIQKLIDKNPNRTLFFPDGIYLISKPLVTPANPQTSVALELSNYAIIRAKEGWNHEEAMIRLGGKDPANNISIPGSNYYLEGGIIDGMGVAKGISIDGGRETAIRNTSIKNVTVGIHIKHGANSGSSDSDINNVNIVGNRTSGSVGVLIEGHDNTLTNMRIGGVHTGVHVCSGGNSLRNIHPLYYNSDENYETSCGFIDERFDNWYDFCYSDQFAIGFLSFGGKSFYDHCFVYWYSNKGPRHTVFKSNGRFTSSVTNMNAGIGKHNATTENVILDVAEDGGNGIFFNLNIGDPSLVTDHEHEKYMR